MNLLAAFRRLRARRHARHLRWLAEQDLELAALMNWYGCQNLVDEYLGKARRLYAQANAIERPVGTLTSWQGGRRG